MKRFWDREEGVAMITALLVSMIVLLVSLTLVQLSIHNSTSSATDRDRVQSVNAAEAGVNLVFSTMERTGFAALPCTLDGDLNTTPLAHYHVEVDYFSIYPITGSALSCPLTGNPAGATITSVGSVPAAAGGTFVERTIESEVRLSPVSGTATFLGAVYGQNSVSMTNTTTVNGYQGNDANVYTGGSWSCSNTATIYGSVYAGSVTQGGTCTVNVDVWANAGINASKLIVGHDLTSSTSSISLSGSSHVIHNATAGTTCSGCTGRVDGTITTNHISPAPPLPTFPTIEYSALGWQTQGFTINTYSDCTAAKNFLLDPGDATKYVVRITPTCTLSISSQAKMKVYNDIAIITDGTINVTNKFEMNSVDGQMHTVYWIVPTSSNPTCGNGLINFNNEVKTSNVRIFVYSPCAVNWTNKTAVEGQIFGSSVSMTNSFDFDYYPIAVPGISSTSGFNTDISYIREVV